MKPLFKWVGIIDRLSDNRIYGNIYEAAADKIPDPPVSQVGSDKDIKNE